MKLSQINMYKRCRKSPSFILKPGFMNITMTNHTQITTLIQHTNKQQIQDFLFKNSKKINSHLAIVNYSPEKKKKTQRKRFVSRCQLQCFIELQLNNLALTVISIKFLSVMSMLIQPLRSWN